MMTTSTTAFLTIDFEKKKKKFIVNSGNIRLGHIWRMHAITVSLLYGKVFKLRFYCYLLFATAYGDSWLTPLRSIGGFHAVIR